MIGKTALSLALIAVLASSSPGFAQEGLAQFLFVQQITAAPGKIAQFEDVVGRINEAYKQTGPSRKTRSRTRLRRAATSAPTTLRLRSTR